MTTDPLSPRWHRISLLVASLQCIVWGLFILALPEKSAIAYGFESVPTELFLWQGTGLVILLFGVGYGIAASNPKQHWAVILIGLLAKILGPLGMAWSVLQGDVPRRVLYLIPLNDLVWWVPLTLILLSVFRTENERG